MSHDEVEEVVEEQTKEEELVPLEVKVVNKVVRESSPYDGHDDYEYDDLMADTKDIEDFENKTD